MRTALPTILLAALVSAGAATAAGGQTLSDLRGALERGGGWVPIEIRDGRGRLATLPVPTAGMVLEGYFQIWDHNPGSWTLTATDPLNQPPGAEPLLQVEARAGERVDFSQRTGVVSRLLVEVRWSEPGDTTLWVWVGLGDDPPPPTTRGSGG